MQEIESINYKRIENALRYLHQNFRQQPQLNEVAAHLGMSPFHFQRLFTDWAGVSPKKFLQYLTVEYAKDVLRQKGATLFDAAEESGLSGTSRLHDLFVNIEGMTPGEYKSGGSGLFINYAFSESRFGRVLTAATHKGLCRMVFTDEEQKALEDLKREFPNATLDTRLDEFQQKALGIFEKDWTNASEIKLHLKGTEFQLKVWQSLLQIPFGHLSSYGKIAGSIGSPQASRAVGSAVGDNPVAYVIPCHRVVQASGRYGEYRWGSDRKKLLIGWEASQTNLLHETE